MVRHREEAENEDYHPKAYREEIDSNADDAGKVEWTPDEYSKFGSIIKAVPRADPTSTATIQQEAFGDDIGSVQAGNAERNDVVEGR